MRTTSMTIFLLICLAAAAPAQPGRQDEVSIRRASLDTVWETVNEYHYDTTFGGVNWKEIHDRYLGLIEAAQDDEAFIKLLNRMLSELKLSHFAVFQASSEARSGSPAFSEATIGVDLRILDDDAVITSVDPDFPAAHAGLKPGYVVRRIGGKSVRQMLDDARARDHARPDERNLVKSVCKDVIKRCFGQSGDSVRVTFEDENGIEHDVVLAMKPRTGGRQISEDLPDVYVDFRAERLADNIGYISFSNFFPPADSLFLSAIERMPDLRGLIIDIRGNAGGDHEIGEAMASKLLKEKTLFSVFRYRDSTVRVSVEPNPPVYEGPIVILVDGLTGSASERFSACMQSVGRATIIGERSSARVGPSDLKRLPNGASFMYLTAQSLTPNGTVLEGRGVIPDITVSLTKKALLRGVDQQMERSVACLKAKTN
jgi:carboxyl-terminal processing protease